MNCVFDVIKNHLNYLDIEATSKDRLVYEGTKMIAVN